MSVSGPGSASVASRAESDGPGAPASTLQARRAVGVLVSGLALVLIAFVFDAVPLFVPGVALAAIGALAPAWVWGSARGARVRRVLAAERVVEDEPLEATLEIRRGVLGLGWSRFQVVDPFTGSRLALAGPQSPPREGRRVAMRVAARFERRGEHVLAPPSLVAGDPLELARVHTAGAGATQTLLVLPRTEPVRWLGAERGRRLDRSEGDTSAEAMAATDLEGLRPYRPGTPASRIHWPAVARGRGLIERRLQADGDNRPLVVLDARERDGAGPEPLDAAVRAAASLVLELARGGGCGLLAPGQSRATRIDPELGAWPGAYARLALVGTDPSRPAAGPPRLAGAAGRTGPLIYVTAAPAERLVAGLIAAAGGPVVLVVPDAELVDGRPRGAPGRMLATLAVSGCRGFAVGARGGSARPRAYTASPAPRA